MNSFDLIRTIHSKGENYSANIIRDNGRSLNGKPCYFWFGDMDNDVDGTPYWNKDEYGQSGTTLQYNGKPVNGDIIRGIVVPPEVVNMTPEIVMGCMGTIEYHGIMQSVVVFDSGPRSKIGEGSPAALRSIGVPAFENGNGGVDEQEVLYRIWPGVPAIITIADQKYQFSLQPS